MKHEQKKKWKAKWYRLHRKWNISLDEIDALGEAWRIAKAHELEIKVGWTGGKGTCDSTFDIELIVESQRDNEPHYVMYKLATINQSNRLEVIDIDHSCGYTRYENVVGRFPGICKHLIGAYLCMQENSKEILKDHIGLRIAKNYRFYNDPSLFWVRPKYDPTIMSYYNHLQKRSDVDSIDKRDKFYEFLFYYPR